MRIEQGFVDLRGVGEQDGADNESFWPSFTDIMTVIVMIFLIAMVVLLMRNMELINQLRSTMEAERMAANLARETSEEKESLALKLIDAENKLSVLRMDLLKKDEQNQQQALTLQQQRKTISSIDAEKSRLLRETTQLTKTRDRLTNELQQTTMELQGATSELALARQDLDIKIKQLNAATHRLDTIRQALDQREQQLAQQQADLENARQALNLSDSTLGRLQNEYGSLQRKYNKLIRPARSPLGKYVVEVRYLKVGGKERIELKADNRPGFTPVSRDELYARLARLKKAHDNKLYIKVIIPEDSGLSYSEAWKFTTQLHRRYDYYFQDQAKPGE